MRDFFQGLFLCGFYVVVAASCDGLNSQVSTWLSIPLSACPPACQPACLPVLSFCAFWPLCFAHLWIASSRRREPHAYAVSSTRASAGCMYRGTIKRTYTREVYPQFLAGKRAGRQAGRQHADE